MVHCTTLCRKQVQQELQWAVNKLCHSRKTAVLSAMLLWWLHRQLQLHSAMLL
jgi:hypothetical protein